MGLFASNVPLFFSPRESDAFCKFLNELPGPFFVIEYEGRHLACGGYVPSSEKSSVDLCWGMVGRNVRGKGLGRLMMLFRVGHILRGSATSLVHVNTSQHTYQILEKIGFGVAHVEKDGYAPGIHRYEMTLPPNEELRETVLRELRVTKDKVAKELGSR